MKGRTGNNVGKEEDDTEEDDRNEREVTNHNSNTKYVGNHVGFKVKFGRVQCEDRTPRRTHIFLSLVSAPHLIALYTRACVRVAQVKLVT